MKFNTAKDSYDTANGSREFLNFLASSDGLIFRQVIGQAFIDRLGQPTDQHILDVACGSGWLSGELSHTYKNISGCDGSKFFLESARKNFSNIKFQEVDLNTSLPYSDNSFDTLIMSMAAHDVEDQRKTFTELRRIVKPGGKLMLTIMNPYYAFPVGVWKRGLLGRLFNWQPKLLVRPYFEFANSARDFTFHNTLETYFYKLSEHINNISSTGFQLQYMSELQCAQDSNTYNLQYRLHRFPIILYLEFNNPH